MRKLLFCVTLLLLTNASVVVGQTPDAAPPSPFPRVGDAASEAERLLKSQGNRERAWGAYLAGAYGMKEHASLLVGLLEDPNVAAGGWEEEVVRQAALDALIRLDAEVPAEKLLPLYAASADEVIILLSRAPKRNERELLSLFNEEIQDARWAAVGNLLTEARAPGFAARLLSGLKVEASVYVYDWEGERGYGSDGSGGGGCGGAFHTPEGFPPVGYYALSTSGVRGSVVFAPGRKAVYYARTLRPDMCGERSGRWLARDERRTEYLAEMLGTTEEELKLDARPFREVVCTDAQQCGRALAALRDELVGAHTRALARLLEAELLDPAEAAELKPDITLHLNDARDRRKFPLPGKLKGVKVEILVLGVEPPADSDETPEDAPR
jgi:hypothetical protein